MTGATAGGAEQLARPEQRRLLRGEGRYLDDITLPGLAELAFVRSPHAHARIRAVDTAAARRLEGVLDVVTGEMLAGHVSPIRAEMRPDSAYRYRSTDWEPMPGARVRYVGEIVAAVIATDRYRAEDGAGLVEVDYEPLEPVPSAQSALAADAPVLHAGFDDNVLFHLERASGDAGAFEAAPIRARVRCRHPRVAGLSMEGCGAIAAYDEHSGELTVWSSTQTPHLIRDGLGRCLGLPVSRIRVIAPDVGGGFGVKMHLFPEEVICGYLALRLRRPVKWTQDRMEHLQASFHARDITVEAEVGAAADGTLLGLRARSWCDVGAYSAFPVTASLEPQTVGVALAGPYRLPYYAYESFALATNKFPKGAYRGVGFPLGPLVLEALMDRVARATGLDPAVVRERNLLHADDLPYASPGGAIYDSGDYPALLAQALEHAPYAGWKVEREQARAAGRYLGIGLACFVESTGMNRAVYRARGMLEVPAFDAAVVRIGPDASVHAFVSTPTQGQGQAGTFRRMLGGALGIPDAAIRITLGDTLLTPYGSGTFASRSVVSGGGALLRAAAKMKQKLCEIAAADWGIEAAEVDFTDGAARRRDGRGESTGLTELARMAHSPTTVLGPDLEPGLEVQAAYDPPGVPVSAGTHLALVEVDRRTGGVRVLRYLVAEDCGPIVNPMAVEGQIQGAVVQGLGCALLESIDYDAQAQHRSATLADYLIPGTHDAPRFQIIHRETPSPHTMGGHKGMGESGTIGAPAAIANAVLDALGAQPEEIALPLTPERVLALAGRGRGGAEP